MRSSKMDKLFNCTPVPEETKSLSPFTYYQPFQSSFDPDFALQSAKSPQEDSRLTGGHGRGRVESSTGPSPMSGDRILNPWDYNQPGSCPQMMKTYPMMASTSSWRGDERNQPAAWPGYGPRHSFPNFQDESKGLGLYPSFRHQRGDGRGGCFGALESSGRVRGGHSTPEATGYSVFGRSVLKTGQSRPMICNFCKNNKEVPDIYLNHYLYDPDTKVLTCPVLRKHVCEICGGTGDRAHTLQYCPVNRERGLQAKVPVLLKTRTITNSTGKIRRN